MGGFNTNDVPGAQVGKGQPGANMLRQYGAVPQTLAANNVPVVGTTSGIGTGGGAFVQIGQTNGSQGAIEVLAGTNPAAGGSIALVFPSTPPTLFIAASPDSFGTLSQATVSNTVTISWTGKLGASRRHKINYQWSTSK